MPSLDLDAAGLVADSLFAPDAAHGRSLALVVMQSGDVQVERYGTQPDTVFGPGGPVAADTTLISWSMAKSITHAAVGILVGEGRLSLDAPAPVAAWRGTDKETITLQHLLNMRSGLHFVEDYVDDAVSNCIEMLLRRRSARHGGLRGLATTRPPAGRGVELLEWHHQHRRPHRG